LEYIAHIGKYGAVYLIKIKVRIHLGDGSIDDGIILKWSLKMGRDFIDWILLVQDKIRFACVL
jgi:hypothetical protein